MTPHVCDLAVHSRGYFCCGGTVSTPYHRQDDTTWRLARCATCGWFRWQA